jgi:hypothetical protein
MMQVLYQLVEFSGNTHAGLTRNSIEVVHNQVVCLLDSEIAGLVTDAIDE